MTLLKSWNKGLEKTKRQLFSNISRIFHKGIKPSESLFEELEEILIGSDIGVDTASMLIDRCRSLRFDEGDPAELVRSALREEISAMLTDRSEASLQKPDRPEVILVVGVNGTGKTTTIGKLAWQIRQSGQKVLLAGADTFRAAAAEQLEIWARRADAECICQPMGADAASVAFDALNAALARGIDVLLIDTAGRLHTRTNLMEELKKIRRVLEKRMPGAPHQTLLVLDATMGQNGFIQAEQFARDVGVTHVILTKLDGTARGGIVLSIHSRLGIPVKWVGVGEAIEDLLPFDPEAFADALFDRNRPE